MKKNIFLITILLLSLSVNAQQRKASVDSNCNGFFWFDSRNDNSISKDSVRVIASIIIVAEDLHKPDYYASIYLNDKKIVVDKNGSIDILMPKGEYILKAQSGYAARAFKTNKIKMYGKSIMKFKFYLKAGIISD
ncbi:MAG: hypothetical protein KA319_08250 [Ferruginibacter sp.]|nr:hypothetical protein [Ferruginibacter sp.]